MVQIFNILMMQKNHKFNRELRYLIYFIKNQNCVNKLNSQSQNGTLTVRLRAKHPMYFYSQTNN